MSETSEPKSTGRATQRIYQSFAFMFGTTYSLRPTEYAMQAPQLQQDYAHCWKGLARMFTGNIDAGKI